MSFDAINESRIPTSIPLITMNIISQIMPETLGVEETMVAYASVTDQDGNRIAEHRGTHTELVALGLMTVAERDQLQAFVQTFRARVEALLTE